MFPRGSAASFEDGVAHWPQLEAVAAVHEAVALAASILTCYSSMRTEKTYDPFLLSLLTHPSYFTKHSPVNSKGMTKNSNLKNKIKFLGLYLFLVDS